LSSEKGIFVPGIIACGLAMHRLKVRFVPVNAGILVGVRIRKVCHAPGMAVVEAIGSGLVLGTLTDSMADHTPRLKKFAPLVASCLIKAQRSLICVGPKQNQKLVLTFNHGTATHCNNVQLSSPTCKRVAAH
jgi:hypothetical protein